MEIKTLESATTETIGTGSLFNTLEATKTCNTRKNASKVSYTADRHIPKAICDAEAKLSVLVAMESTKNAGVETKSQLSADTLDGSHYPHRQNVTSPQSKTWVQEWVEEDPHNQPWHGLALDGMLPYERATASGG